MEEHGIVIKSDGTLALVRAARSSACESCASKSGCAGASGEEMLIEAVDNVGCGPGDRVVFEVGAASVFKAGVMLYLVPILCFIAGVVIGQIIAKAVLKDYNADLVAGAVGALFLAGAFIGLKLYGKVAEKRGGYRPRILRKE